MDSSFYNDILSIIDEYGWWMVLRSFDLTKRSTYWNIDSQEAVGGPAWEYNDIIFKGRRTETVASNTDEVRSRGMLTDIYRTTFYIMGAIRPKKEDIIIEIDPSLRQVAKPPKKVIPYEIFNIEHVESKIEVGTIVAKCYCTKRTPVNDATLLGEIPTRYKPLITRK